jgi:hypothetical protein
VNVNNERFQHALNGSEVRIDCGENTYKVDGQLRTDAEQVYPRSYRYLRLNIDNFTLQVFEFYGCLYHGCPTCYPDRNSTLPHSNQTMHDAYSQTMQRERNITAQG